MELTIEIKAKPGKFHELDQTLQAILPTMRLEKGCGGCRVSRDEEDGETFFLSIEWEAQADLANYMRSTYGLALLGALDLLSEKATVKTGHDGLWEGVDTLKRIRKKTRRKV